MPKFNVTGTVTAAERINNSADGNPRYSVTIACDDGYVRMYATAADAAVNFELPNYVANAKVKPVVTLRIGTRSTIESMTSTTGDRGQMIADATNKKVRPHQ